MKYCANPKHKRESGILDGILTRDEVQQGFTYCLVCRCKGFKDPGVKKKK